MTFIASLFCAVSLGAIDKPEITRDQLHRILQVTASRIRDIEFIYEGSVRSLDRTDNKPNNIDQDFQGTFAQRSDGATHMSIYVQSRDISKPLRHESLGVIGTRMTHRLSTPDQDAGEPPNDRVSQGSLASFTRPMSAGRILLFPIFMAYMAQSNLKIEPEKWETVGKRRCLKVLVYYDKPESGEAYWLDLERDGNVLKFEDYTKGQLRGRIDEITLGLITGPTGEQVWIPVKGRDRSFLNLHGTSKSPTVEELYTIVNGTVELNRGLPDSRFSIDAVPGVSSPSLSARRSQPRSVRTSPKPRLPPAARIDLMLEEADKQSKQLEASSPARQPWWQTNTQSILFLSLGVCALGIALVLLRRIRA